jgi:1-acyl-sn-glycerol-3-phosphate acyltransferase
MSRETSASEREDSAHRGGSRWPIPEALRSLFEEIDERITRLPTRLNEYGYDPFGLDPEFGRPVLAAIAFAYRHWFRVEARGVGNVPEGRVLLIGNHAGNTFAWDGAMVAEALFLEGDPPRIVRGMAEYFLPTIPFFNVYMQRFGSIVGTPENCIQLLEQDEAIMAFPEGQRGFVKTYRRRYQLQTFGLGFMRLALETDTPIVPVGIVGSEEQSPGLANIRSLGRLVGSPAFPITLTFPWLGPAGFVPLPVKYYIEFGEPLRFEGDPTEDDATIGEKVGVVKDAIEKLIEAGLSRRRGWFS